MHALSIEIENFRRFTHFSCQFHPRFTLLVGPNGSGKSSLLRALHGCIHSLADGASVHLNARVGATEVRRAHSTDPANEAWRTPVYPCTGKLWVELQARERLFGFEVTAQNSRIWDISGDARTFAREGWQAAQAAASAWFDPASPTSAPLIARYGAVNALAGSQPGAVQKPFESKQDVWKRFESDVVDATWLAQWFQYNELRTLQEGQPPLVYRLTKQAVLSAIHAQDIKYVVRDNQLMLLHDDQGWRPFDELSDGQRRIAAIFCDLALRCASLNSQLTNDCITGTPGIVTIDELDLHLHPAWQRTVVDDLLRVFPKLQFIATSHSPFLLQAAFEHGAVVDMRSGAFAQATDLSIEDITEGVMGVAQPQRGVRFLALKAAAARYLALLESSPSSTQELAQLRHDLDQALAVFADEPASAAWLQQRREVAGV